MDSICAAQVTYDDASAREADADDTHLAVRSAGLDLRMQSYMAGRIVCKVCGKMNVNGKSHQG